MDSLKIFTGNANPDLSRQICAHLGLKLGQATVSQFPDGESSVKIQENIRGVDVFLIQPMQSPGNHFLMELLLMIDAAKRASAARITAVIPFYGYARQDRKDQSRVPISAKLVANLLMQAGASRVITVDLHSQQIVGFFDIPVDHLYAAPLFFEYLSRKHLNGLTVCSPDLGRMSMATAYAERFQCPLSMVFKRRGDGNDVEAVDLMGCVAEREVVIVDDLMATGQTIALAAKVLKEAGARSIRAIVSHCTVPTFPEICFDDLDELITTDTTSIALDYAGHSPKVTILSVAPLLAEAIKRIHTHQSVSGLFSAIRH